MEASKQSGDPRFKDQEPRGSVSGFRSSGLAHGMALENQACAGGENRDRTRQPLSSGRFQVCRDSVGLMLSLGCQWLGDSLARAVPTQ